MNQILSKIADLHTSGNGKSGITQSGVHIELVKCDIRFVFDHNIVIVDIVVACNLTSNGRNVRFSRFRRSSLAPGIFG